MNHPAGTGSARLRGERLRAQRLSGEPPPGPVAAVRALLAIQAQDPLGWRLAIRARTPAGASVDELERELSQTRTLIVSWLNRGTLHLVCAEDLPWLQALTTAPLHTGSARRLAQEGVSPAAAERGTALIARWLCDEGPLWRRELRERLDRAGIPTAGQALVHLLFAASLKGLIVRGPVGRNGEQGFVAVDEWLGTHRPVERGRALAELARRYLGGHAPASDRDLARWAGLPLRDARAGLRAIAAELEQRPDGLLELRRRAEGPPAELPPPRLLGPFEPSLLGWAERAWILPQAEEIVLRNGIFRAFALVRGRAAAVWRLRGREVELEPLRRLSRPEIDRMRRDGQDVARYLGR